MCAGMGAPKELVALALVSASRAAACPYCTAHTASFAQRRGVNPTLSAGTVTDACIQPRNRLHSNCRSTARLNV